MKRIGNLHAQICTLDNIELADDKARRHKSNNWGIKKHDKHRLKDNLELQLSLLNLTYLTSLYSTFKIYEPKEREIFRLPYFPDRIAHHSIMNITEPIWVNSFIKNTYSCIKGRGIHKLVKDLKSVLKKDIDGTRYCLKLDIKKFYPSLDHPILKQIIRRKIKDKNLLVLLDEIIDSSQGVPIGNYLSLFFANLYLTYFDHWLKEVIKVKHYFRYADDIVIFADNKIRLHSILNSIMHYVPLKLHLLIKSNYLIFPVDKRGVDFVGYKFYHTHTLLRKSIKLRIFKLISKYKHNKINLKELRTRLSSYFGWTKFCNSKVILKYILQLTGLHYSNWEGKESLVSSFYNKSIRVFDVVIYSLSFRLNFIYNNTSYSVKSKSKKLKKYLTSLLFPVNLIIKNGRKKNNILYLTLGSIVPW